jgi:integrase
MNFEELTDVYLKSNQFVSLAHNTKANYFSKVDSIRTWNIDEEDAFLASRRLYSCIESMTSCNNTKNIYIMVLKAIYNWGERMNLIQPQSNPCRFFPRLFVVNHNKPKDYYTKQQIEMLWSKADTHKDKCYANFMRFMFYTGCRVSEVINLKWGNIRDGYINIVGGKRKEEGEISRKIKIIPELEECIKYARKIAFRPELMGEYIFVTASQKIRINIVFMRQVIKELCMKCGITYKELRCVRRGLATSMVKAGYDIYTIKAQLGHSNIQTTQRYITPTLEETADLYKGV